MPGGRPDDRELGYYFSLAQVGLEMVMPLGVGAWLDYYFGWAPWATLIGAVFGFVGGLLHLLLLVNQHNASDRPGSGKGGA
jgi:F0F1-type ATP synthase assembly protein I